MKNKPVDAMKLAVLLSVALAAPPGFAVPLEDLSAPQPYKAGRASSHDRTGGNDDGNHLTPILPGEVRTLADLEGPGAVTHIWITFAAEKLKLPLREIVIRMYWDGEAHPSVEAPLGDFFGLGHGLLYHYQNAAFEIDANNGLNCFWFMPFGRSARIEAENQGENPVRLFYYYVDYRKYDKDPGGALRFHAQYRQERPVAPGGPYALMEAKGRGHYVGANLSVQLNRDGWWGEGDDMFFVDGEAAPSLHGTGSEDYFGGAWGYGAPFSHERTGAPLIEGSERGDKWNVYRLHVDDPIPFERSLRAVIEHGHANDRTDNMSSAAYWYQTEPHEPFAPMPPSAERFPVSGDFYREAGGFEEFEDLVGKQADSSGDALTFQFMPDAGETRWSAGAQALFAADAPGDFVAFEEDVPTDLLAAVELFVATGPDYGIWGIKLNGKPVGKPIDAWSAEPGRKKIKLPKTTLYKGKNRIELTVIGKNEAASGHRVGVDCGRITPMGAPPPKRE